MTTTSSSRPSFDVAQQPCIPVLQGSELKRVSLRDALTNAHEYDELQHEVPTVEFGLYRLLVALAIDIFFVEPGEKLNEARLAKLLSKGSFDAIRVDAYFDRHPDTFDLFHAQTPFLQSGQMAGKEKPVANLMPPVPSGTNVTHFHRAHEDEFAVTPGEALGLLASIAPFMTAGGAGLSPSINGAPPVYVLVRGKNLFETLCLNVSAQELPLASDQDVPAWRSTRAVRGERQHSGYVESLTWRPRRVQLIPQLTPTGLTVRAMRFEAGDSTRFEWRDPNTAYRLSDKGSTVVRLREGRDLWRDLGPLALLHGGKTALRPLVVEQFAHFIDDRLLPRTTALELTLYGMRTDMKMKIFEWRRDELRLPVALLLQGQGATFGEEVQQRWLHQAELVAYVLRLAVKKLYPRGGGGNEKAFGSRVAYVERGYWSALRGTFEALLVQLASVGSDVAAWEPLRLAWRRAVEREARTAFGRASDGLGTGNHVLERATRARRSLEFGMRRVFDPAPPDDKLGRGKRRGEA